MNQAEINALKEEIAEMSNRIRAAEAERYTKRTKLTLLESGVEIGDVITGEYYPFENGKCGTVLRFEPEMLIVALHKKDGTPSVRESEVWGYTFRTLRKVTL